MSELPVSASLEQLRNQAKSLVKSIRNGDSAAAERVHTHLPRTRTLSIEQILKASLTLTEAQLIIAREHGFPSWPRLKAHVETLSPAQQDIIAVFRTAVRGGDAGAVRALLQRHEFLRAEIDSPWFDFDAPALNIAAGRQDRPMIQALLEFGADPNTRSHWWAGGFSPLSQANPETAQLLIAHGATVDIHDAAHLDMPDRVRELLALDPALVNARGGDGQSPLHFARSVEVAALLVDHGADLEMRDLDHGSTAAQTVVANRPDVCRYLLSRGATPDIFMAAQLDAPDIARRILTADPSALNARVGVAPFTSGDSDGGHIYVYTLKTGESPLYLAAMLGHNAVAEVLLAYASPAQRLAAAVVAADAPLARRLVTNDSDLLTRLDPTELRVLPDAAWRNRIETVRLALDIGFPVDAVGAEESTALNRAAVRGYADIVALTLERGADPGRKNAFGGPALGSALWGCKNFRDPAGDYPRTIGLLLQTARPWRELSFPTNNPDVDAVIRQYLEQSDGLCAAVLLNDVARVAALLATGTDPDAPEQPDDITPRELAARDERSNLLPA
jgi:ankyrin repeat protein